jgi:hypothetical protein
LRIKVIISSVLKLCNNMPKSPCISAKAFSAYIIGGGAI